MNATPRSVAALLFLAGPLSAQAPDPNDLSARVEIFRTAYGVPHIRAEDLRAYGHGLAWIQLEDYGAMVAQGILRSRGDMARVFGHDSIETDFITRPMHALARASYHLLDQPTRDVYEGFAAGVNRYVTLHRDEFAPGFPADFSGYDVATRDVEQPSVAVEFGEVPRAVSVLAYGESPRPGSP